MDRMPVLFVGHGNPMNAISENEYSEGWRSLVEGISRPAAILCISAHWESRGPMVNTTARPGTIHDFYGFPEELYRVRYPCPGSPDMARAVTDIVSLTEIHTDPERGLDHGTWAVVLHMYPEADLPVFQLSLDATMPPEFHYALGRELRPLREQGVLIVGSGNLVHNLGVANMSTDDHPYPWALSFDLLVRDLIEKGDHGSLINYRDLGPEAGLSVPTNEHYLPLLYTLALQDEGEPVFFVNDKVALRSVSMRSLRIG